MKFCGRRSPLLLVAAALACGPKTADTLLDETAGSTGQPLTTTGQEEPTNTADPTTEAPGVFVRGADYYAQKQ